MSKVESVILNTDPHRPTDFNAKAIQAAIDAAYVIGDIKKDGVRLNLVVEPGASKGLEGNYLVNWLSREGKAFPVLALTDPLDCDARWHKFFNPNLGEGLHGDVGFMLDAELVLVDRATDKEIPCKNISGRLRRVKAGPLDLSTMRVYVFAVVPLDQVLAGGDTDIMNSVMEYRVAAQVKALKDIFPEIEWIIAPSMPLYSMQDIDTVFEAVRQRGGEGLVLKDPNEVYRRGKVTGWWKCVPDDNEDGKVVGLVWGTKGLANEGKVIGFEVLLESGHVVNACKVSQQLMDEFTRRVLEVGEDAYDGWTVRVTFMERYPDGSLRHPSFDCFRGISDPKIKE